MSLGTYAAAVRPILIAEIALPAFSWASWVPEVGWLVIQPADRSVTVLDAGLRAPVRTAVPVHAPQFMASVSERHLAVVTLDELVVADRDGAVLWRREHELPEAGEIWRPNCHLDAGGVLWVYLPNGDELVAYDAAAGREIDRVPLNSTVGVAHFFPHPDGERIGFYVAMGQDRPLSHVAWLAGGRIRGRDLPGGFLAGFTTSGDRYLAMPHADAPELAFHDLASGAVVAACDPAAIPGHDGEYRLMEAAVLADDDTVLVAVSTDDFATDFEDHLALTTRGLGRRAHVDYGRAMTHNSIAAGDGHGRWLTRNKNDATVRLWQLPGHIDDEVEGQLGLW